MKTKPLTFLLSLTFLFSIFILTSCSSTRPAYFQDGKEVNYNDPNYRRDNMHCRVFAQTGTPPPIYKRDDPDTSDKVTKHSGTITDQSGSTLSYRGTSKTQPNLSARRGMKSFSKSLHNLGEKMRHMSDYNSMLDECMFVMGYTAGEVPR